MKIKIEEDVFGIVDRLKGIDDGYFVVFDTKKQSFEVHNEKQSNTYCLTIPYDCLDSRTLQLVNMTNIQHIDNIVEDIDRNNMKVEENSLKDVKNKSDFMLREIYNFCNNSSKKFDENSFETKWR